MVIGVRLELEQERQLDRLARQQGMTRSACIREAIRQVLLRHGDSDETRFQLETWPGLSRRPEASSCPTGATGPHDGGCPLT